MNVFVTSAGGYSGGSVASGFKKRGHKVRGLTCTAVGAKQLKSCAIHPVIGNLDDSGLLKRETAVADMVSDTANADHRGAVEALNSALSHSEKKELD